MNNSGRREILYKEKLVIGSAGHSHVVNADCCKKRI